MRLPDLKFNFSQLPPHMQRAVFLDYSMARQRDLDTPAPCRVKTTTMTTKKAKGEKTPTITLSSQQLEVLRKLNIL